jgi:FkbM family methyltransferase
MLRKEPRRRALVSFPKIKYRYRAFSFLLSECCDLPTRLSFCRYAARLGMLRLVRIRRSNRVIQESEMFLRLKQGNVWFAAALEAGELASYLEIHRDRVYDSKRTHIEPGDVILDVGANIGMFSIRFGRLFRDTTIYAFEPNPSVYRRLVRNISANALTKVEPINVAIASSAGGRPFFVTGATVTGSLYEGSSNYTTPSFDAETIALDCFCEMRRIRSIGLLKIDVEGAELEVLKGAIKTLRICKQVVVECHTPQLEKEARIFLQSYGFEGRVKSEAAWGPRVIEFACSESR